MKVIDIGWSSSVGMASFHGVGAGLSKSRGSDVSDMHAFILSLP